MGDDATASEDAGFDSTSVVSLRIDFNGSAAIDNLVIGSIDPNFFIPEPTALALASIAGLLTLGRRDR